MSMLFFLYPFQQLLCFWLWILLALSQRFWRRSFFRSLNLCSTPMFCWWVSQELSYIHQSDDIFFHSLSFNIQRNSEFILARLKRTHVTLSRQRLHTDSHTPFTTIYHHRKTDRSISLQKYFTAFLSRTRKKTKNFFVSLFSIPFYYGFFSPPPDILRQFGMW